MYSTRKRYSADTIFSQNTKNRPVNTYVVKTYNAKHTEIYWDELVAFERLVSARKQEQGLVAFYGAFVSRRKYNLLFEYADKGTLEQYFHHVNAPFTGEDILMFWTSLFQIIEALARIHRVKSVKDYSERYPSFRFPFQVQL
jgi:hypothetical protein